MSDPKTTVHIRIPGYRIEREIGRGGIATVYLAVQESLDREVALKVMSPVLVAEPNFTERFIGEGRMVAQLNHPSIVTIFDIAAENYHTYMAMEYLSGGNLREKLRQAMPENNILSIVRQIANALACAHDSGIVHRDVKPENIMFRDNDVPVLTDFGIAKTIGSDERLTRTGIIVGTPRYISPEQAEGHGTDVRSDLYSLGVILFEMLAGRPPFGTSDSIALLYAHVNDPIPDLPEEHRHLQPLVNATMAKDPDQRVSDCHKLSDMIYVILREVRRGNKGAVSTVPRTGADNIVNSPGDARPQASVTPRNKLRPFVIGGVGMLLVALVLTAGLRALLTPQSESELADVSDPQTTSAVLAPLEPVQQESEGGVAPASGSASSPDTARRMQLDAEVANAAQRGFEPGESSTPSPAMHTPSPAMQEAPAAPEPAVQSPPIAVAKTGRAPDPPAASLPKPVVRANDQPSAPPAWKMTKPGNRSGPPNRLQALLSRAESQMTQGRVDNPAGDNALETYRRVLRVAADDPQALSGLDDIARYFLDKGRESAEAKRYQHAQEMIERGLQAVPKHSALMTFQQTVLSLFTAEKQFATAEQYYLGQGIQRDLASAVEWYRKAADKGHVQAQYSLGLAYADGAGVSRNEVEGLRWLRRAAIQGVEDAQFNLSLGLIFGPDPDPNGALQWIKKLADKNYEPAFQVLGWMYSTGTGVKLSIKESIRWNVKYVMADAPAKTSPPERVVEYWNRKLQSALAQTRLDQKPPEPH